MTSPLVNDFYFPGDIEANIIFQDNNFLSSDSEFYYSTNGGNSWNLTENVVYGSETQIITNYPELEINMARLNNGNRVLVWKDELSRSLYQVFDSTGIPITEPRNLYTIFGLNVVTGVPSVAALANGGFIVGSSGGSLDISTNTIASWQQFDEQGNRTIDLQPVTASRGYGLVETKIAVLDDGGFVMAFQSLAFTSIRGKRTYNNIRAIRFSSSGVQLNSPPFIVNDNGDPNKQGKSQFDIVALNFGRFAVAWASNYDSASLDSGIYLRTYDVNANPEQSAPIEIELSTLSSAVLLEEVDIEKFSNGNFVVLWSRVDANTFARPETLFAQRFNPVGVGIAPKVEVLNIPTVSGTASLTRRLLLTTLPDANYIAGLTYLDSYTGGKLDNQVKRFNSSDVSGSIFTLSPSLREIISTDEGDLIGYNVETPSSFDSVTVNLVNYNETDYRVFASINGLNNDVNLRFRMFNPVTSQEWLSPSRSLLYLPQSDGSNGQVNYLNGFTATNNISIELIQPCEVCNSVQLLMRQGVLPECNLGEFSIVNGAQRLGNTFNFTAQPNYCYQFYAQGTNAYNITHDYCPDTLGDCNFDSDSLNQAMVRVDQTPPSIAIINDLQEGNALSLDLQITDNASTSTFNAIQTSTYQLDDQPPVTFTGNTLSVDLPDGTSRLRIVATDLAGNTGQIERFYEVTNNSPEIVIHGIEDGGTYGSIIDFTLSFTQELTNVQIFVDGQLVNNLNNLSNGNHTITITGVDAQNNTISTSINITVDSQALSINLLSPQNRTYQTNTVNIQYASNEPLTEVSYRLNGGPLQQELTLSDLADGDYTLVLTGTSADGRTAIVNQTFSVEEAIPTLEVFSPQLGQVLSANQLTPSFLSNATVSYQLGEQSGVIQSGDTINLPGDGNHTLILTATHPVSGQVVSQQVSFASDTVIPTLSLESPRATLYPFTEIPIVYDSN